ncbi:hypothetical protein CIPAW_07G009300 [Carya illinoinensis]|uniref:Uncharacterized protein n=1 Tax=Carya illinoinensis TaxID=32201 RepID=A0A8T1PPN5_CARIL|nr:hypothetical protein CIPAW_07G009300 [Carya illinoinensis]
MPRNVVTCVATPQPEKAKANGRQNPFLCLSQNHSGPHEVTYQFCFLGSLQVLKL